MNVRTISRQEATEEYFVQKNIFLIAIEHPIEAGVILPAFDWRDIMFTITIKKTALTTGPISIFLASAIQRTMGQRRDLHSLPYPGLFDSGVF